MVKIYRYTPLLVVWIKNIITKERMSFRTPRFIWGEKSSKQLLYKRFLGHPDLSGFPRNDNFAFRDYGRVSKRFINLVNTTTILLFLFIALSVKAQSFTAKASTDSLDYKVGDFINYKLELTYDKNVHPFIPSIKDSLKKLDLIKELPVKKDESGSQIKETHTFVLAGYDSTQATIPSYPISYTVGSDTAKKYVEVNPVTVTVHTVQINPKGDIQDVKAPVKIQLDWWFIALIVLIVIVILAGAYFGYRYYKKKKEVELGMHKVIIKIPPHEIALSDLRRLEEKKLWQQGMIKEYHSEITEIIRKYFEARFDIAALEMPSSELLDLLKNVAGAQIIFDKTRDFLNNADMVKFAKFQPLASINEEMMTQAYDIVRSTKPVEVLREEKEDANVQ